MAAQDQIKKLNDQIQEINKQLGGKQIKIFDVKELNEAERVVKSLRTELQDATSDISGLASGFKNVVQEMQNTSKPLADAKKSFNALSGLAQKLQNDQVGINKLSKKELISIKDKIKAEKENQKTLYTNLKQKYDANSITDRELAALVEIEGTLANENVLYNDLLTTARKRLAEETKINDAMGLGGALIGGLKKGLDKLGLGGLVDQLGIDDAKTAMEKVADEVTKGGTETATFGGKVKILKAGIGSLGKSMVRNLTDPLAIAKFLFDEIIGAIQASDKATGELAKGMNMSYNEASSMRNELQLVSNLSGDIFITTKGLQESLMAVNAELGTNVMLNSKNLKTYTKLREAAGLTMEDQKGIVALTNATKGNAEDITKEFLGAARASATKNKSVLNEKTLLKDISNISAATTLSFGKDAGLIGQTVATVKALGLEMGKVEGIADSLLDFESSIENELQAELLLNKDLNLEKARQAALNNDLATVATEIAKQAGSSAEFGEMNRIQQEALAKAVGMNREELAKTLFVQEQIGNVSEEEANLREQRINKLQAEGLSNEQIKKKLGEESFESLKNQASVQERINKSVEKLREVFISIAGPVMQIISPIVDLLIPAVAILSGTFSMIGSTIGYVVDSISGIVGIFTGANEQLSIMQTIVGSIAIGFASILAIQKIKAGWDALSLIMEQRKAKAQKTSLLGLISEMAMKAFNALGGIPVIGPALGIAAAISAATLGYQYYNKAGDVDSAADGKTRISTKEGGLFELSPNDDLVAAPGASKALEMAAKGGGNTTTIVQQAPTPTTTLPQNNEQADKTNSLLEEILNFQVKQPQLSAIGMYEVQ
jgi:uncharacterized membrane protein|tara:strand:+ start:1541 stop:4048 length:2508 start_codon:yes stop_codon:yes gene_type:complete